MLIVTAVFEPVFRHALSDKVPDLLNFQSRLYEAVGHLNPLNLTEYLFGESVGFLWKPIGAFFDGIHNFIYRLSAWAETTHNIPHTLTLFVSAPIVFIVLIVQVALLWATFFLVVVSSPVLLPIIVISKGNALETTLVVVILIPLSVFMARVVIFDRSLEFWDWEFGEKVGFWGLASFTALAITSLFYLLMQLAMVGSLWAFGQLLGLAATEAAASGFVSFVLVCAGKTAEHSLTERVVRVIKSWLLR